MLRGVLSGYYPFVFNGISEFDTGGLHKYHPVSRTRNILDISKSDSVLWIPESKDDLEQVRQQLDQLLIHPLFHHSKRYPALLRYTVEQTLLGHADRLKERTIGVEVFNRKPQYDTNADPVVRFTASEIRKRLAQYYVDPTHFDEIRIDLPTGSYVAVFSRSAREYSRSEHKATRAFDATPWPALPPVEARRPSWSLAVLLLLCAALAGGTGLSLGYWLRSVRQPPKVEGSHATQIDQFWSFITAAPGTVTFCIGEPEWWASEETRQTAKLGGREHNEPHGPRQPPDLAVDDVLTLTHLASALDARGKPYRISPVSRTTFNQLREGPIVLIGAFDNPWTTRLTQNLRFTFVAQNQTDSIVDHRGLSQFGWSVPWSASDQKINRDYAIVARFHDSTTGQPVMLAAGIASEGTEAAGELLSKPEYLNQLLEHAPRNWPSMNVEAVIQTQVIDGRPGPPAILAVEFW